MPLQTPPLRGIHDERGAKFTEFGGWDMPVEFDSIQTEHEAVREDVGIFDVSHMGQIHVTGPDATTLMQRLTTNDVSSLEVGDSQYAAITDEDGIVIDDTVIYRLPDETGDATYLFIPNAGTDEETHERWIDYRNDLDLEATVDNRTDEYAMFAVQGPNAAALVDDVTAESVTDIGRFNAQYATIDGVDCWTARTGYTGEDGFELIVPWEEAERIWSALDCQPCGLGSRDTLRLEAGLLLSGQDFDPEDNPRTPYEAGIGFTVDLETEFVGRDALAAVEEEGVEEELIGFQLIDRGVPRHGYDVTNTDDRVIGTVTSGTMSPTLERAIGFAYVPVEYADPGTTLQVVVRGRSKKARVETTPFIDTA
ncbi:glycine cleavage system aminomethyltransferase GcvT [Natronobacterium gregoryi]|uniref:Probable aminomethyltransferase n=2 Tax=Natronobacterium gregoryi TaxID=44930 RepID=L0ALW8_NATGS|nr:glycine cleavage system aminomethyltransferase GcvT [Natronobacterium gregoryi]AFZ74157.1 glycine cleavage system T protein [Natronobacterium gregoryi SP2]ELY63612.1 glycine cleavage system aminomethyltransferase T [Natronobacterium gregoryi SP2]PLK22050.1 glycine cleavage system protein T [Natronobacterium gregoryi SP2]SFI50511.1 aminomethyltransferase [Natronobacterium gregoryi]